MKQEARIATVSQLNGYIKKILDSNIILNNVWVKGEISNFKLHYSGHMYLTLKDENSVLKAVMFRGSNKNLAFKPEDGMKVMARGRVSVYEAGGAYQLYIEEMTVDGIGDLYIAYEQLKKKLAEEGLFDEQLKKNIPLYPEKVGVVTATTGAAVRDIINVISRRFPYSEIIIYPSLVQGAAAAPNIVEGINYFNNMNMVDTIIVGRGGGSIEDLWAFNDENVARTIFNSHIPIISAVGHETDYTIADFVADLRAPTPSAAAEISVPSQTELLSKIQFMQNKLTDDILRKLEIKRKQIDNIKLKNPQEKINDYSIALDNKTKELINTFKISILHQRERLGNSCAKLDAMSPLSVMARGYSVATDKTGGILRSVKDFKSGKNFDLRVADGTVKCTVTD